jgi:hypothetical protein
MTPDKINNHIITVFPVGAGIKIINQMIASLRALSLIVTSSTIQLVYYQRLNRHVAIIDPLKASSTGACYAGISTNQQPPQSISKTKYIFPVFSLITR